MMPIAHAPCAHSLIMAMTVLKCAVPTSATIPKRHRVNVLMGTAAIPIVRNRHHPNVKRSPIVHRMMRTIARFVKSVMHLIMARNAINYAVTIRCGTEVRVRV